jgi:hypothetical protein
MFWWGFESWKCYDRAWNIPYTSNRENYQWRWIKVFADFWLIQILNLTCQKYRRILCSCTGMKAIGVNINFRTFVTVIGREYKCFKFLSGLLSSILPWQMKLRCYPKKYWNQILNVCTRTDVVSVNVKFVRLLIRVYNQIVSDWCVACGCLLMHKTLQCLCFIDNYSSSVYNYNYNYRLLKSDNRGS